MALEFDAKEKRLMQAVLDAQTDEKRLEAFNQMKVGARRAYEYLLNKNEDVDFMTSRRSASDGDRGALRRVMQIVNSTLDDIRDALQ